MAKMFEEFVTEMVNKGPRELGGFFYQDSNIAVPMYPLRGGYEASKEANEHGMSLGDRLKQCEVGRDDPGRDDPDQGIDRE
jgi:hypothetical protein